MLKCCCCWSSWDRRGLWRCVPWVTGGVSPAIRRVRLGRPWGLSLMWVFSGECISVYQRCRGQCVSSAEAGFREGYSWCSESQQCIPPGVKCAVMWGVGCGKSSFFCWRGNVCLPKSLPCNGNKTKYFRLRLSYQVRARDLIERAKRDLRETWGGLRETWERREREISLNLTNGGTNDRTFWLPELLTEPKICSLS